MRDGLLMSAAPVLPGVWKLKEGGCWTRARVKSPRTGKMVEVRRVLRDVKDARSAYRILQEEIDRIKAGAAEEAGPKKIRFSEYAALVFECRVQERKIRSAAGRKRWALYLEKHLIPHFGNLLMDQIRRADIIAWRTRCGRLIAEEGYSPRTCNDWLAVLATVISAYVSEYELPRNPILGVARFDTTMHRTYTKERPNALQDEEVICFLTTMHRRYPQHFAQTVLGFATGLRPSHMRPIRRKGPEADLNWVTGELLIRRSHSIGGEDQIMDTTKTGSDLPLVLSPDVLDVLRWHVEAQLVTEAQKQSDLLFPGLRGGVMRPSTLREVFASAVKEGGLKYISPRGLRRTNKDLMRRQGVPAVVSKAISGHTQDRTHELYSTAAPAEMREAIGKVAKVFDPAKYRAQGSGGIGGGSGEDSANQEAVSRRQHGA